MSEFNSPLPNAYVPLAVTLPDIPYLTFGEAVTLTNCDREPIHIPGHAQAHGVVVAIDYNKQDTGELKIVQVSTNVSSYCGVAPEDLLEKSAAVLFAAEQIAAIRDAIAGGILEANPL